MRQIIRNWEELASIPDESKTHILHVELKNGCANLYPKEEKPYNKKLSFMRNLPNQYTYLSTHTFYTKNDAKHASKILRVCGFDVELISWDTV